MLVFLPLHYSSPLPGFSEILVGGWRVFNTEINEVSINVYIGCQQKLWNQKRKMVTAWRRQIRGKSKDIWRENVGVGKRYKDCREWISGRQQGYGSGVLIRNSTWKSRASSSPASKQMWSARGSQNLVKVKR